MNRLLSNEKEKEIAPLLPKIIEIKQQICDIVKKNCKICPLNEEDVCSQLELREFDFDNHGWVDDNE